VVGIRLPLALMATSQAPHSEQASLRLLSEALRLEPEPLSMTARPPPGQGMARSTSSWRRSARLERTDRPPQVGQLQRNKFPTD